MITKWPRIERECSLRRYHTYGIDAKAKFLIEVSNHTQLIEALSFVKEENQPFTVLGRGSNVIFKDDYYDGLVIINKMTAYKLVQNTLICEGGVNLPLIARKTAKQNLAGLESLVGIPGTVGGSIFMNAGISGAWISSHLISVEALFLDGRRRIFSKEQCEFSYRSSIFHKNKAVITKAMFDLVPDSNASSILQKNLADRLHSQPIEEKNSGCIFKNPTPQLSAGMLIDKCGLKGLKASGAEISSKHANFINNLGSAKYRDVISLIDRVKAEVKKQKGVDLECEIRVL
ncbi:MAG: UDP-N-acetylenolpyruvoylglucosamine reductase [Chlamydiia bacterium]|nr:UDP-N-acetylenolpyruvoylglucosamine reductase [Chlamydiia bacterium]MCH9618100.1 UDP-N-acetylenolpyruvoylglucosamine reductase [Chlamydiia bacterium]MCH9623980.1 UDP-N-acetylenolpyruvoylglucosamine reductase [Chlamydiia bacterium]